MRYSYIKFPFYARLALILLMLSLIVTLLYLASNIITPLLLSIFFAILLRPLVVFLNTRLRFPHVIAVLVSVVLFLSLIGLIIFFIYSQVANFVNDWPVIRENLSRHLLEIQKWIQQKFDVSFSEQKFYFQAVRQNSLDVKTGLGNTVNFFSQTFLNLMLIPVYTFLILLYRNLFKNFMARLIAPKNHQTMIEIITENKNMIQHYILGLMTQMGIVAVLTTLGFWIIGLPYIFLLGPLTAILNLIPYIGIMSAGIIAITASLTQSTSLPAILGVLLVNTIVQLIDNNFLVPYIVGSRVKINALASIVGVIIGGTLAGIAGMILALPILAILKVIFDRIEGLKPWGLLIGDDMPKLYEWHRLKLPSWKAGNDGSEKNSSRPRKK